jgi:hypothetical protein
MNQAIDYRESWEKTSNWFSTADTKFQYILGAKVNGPDLFTWTCETQVGGNTFTNTVTTTTPTPPDNTCAWYCTVNNNIINKPCDGLILAENAMDFPGVIYPPQQMPGFVDHQQMRNYEGMKGILNNLFNGDYGFFFQTEVNQQ